MSGSMSRSPAATQPGLIEPLVDSFLDFSEYENIAYQSPSLSPVGLKASFSRPIKTENGTTSLLLPTNQTLSGPSHQYDLYKQQTGIVPGALATTHAVNQHNPHIQGFCDYSSLDLLNMGNTDDLFDFNTAPSQEESSSPEMDMDFDSQSNAGFFYDSTVNPNSIGGQEPTSNVGRVWPGMHQQAALARSQQQQRQRAQAQQQPKQKPKSKTPQATDPLVEQKISQLLNTMRAQPSSESGQNSPLHSIPRPRKDEDDMDEDERLLASEEGKKLSSKERRQLRNKVSARAFRSRRKEYIGQLETEIAHKVNENGLLRAENRALSDENKRLTDLTRMLLGSPAFSEFLNTLSSEAQPQLQLQQPQQQQQQQQQQQPQQQQQQQRQVPKDANPYAAQQQIGLAMIPEQTLDFSMLSMEPIDAFGYQPQVYTTMFDVPEPTLDAAILSGKTTSFVSEHMDASADEDKVDLPLIDRPAASARLIKEDCPPAPSHPVDEAFENDPAFSLWHDAVSSSPDSTKSDKTEDMVELDADGVFSHIDFAGIVPEKEAQRFELVDAGEQDAAAERVRRICAGLEGVRSRLEVLTVGL